MASPTSLAAFLLSLAVLYSLNAANLSTPSSLAAAAAAPPRHRPPPLSASHHRRKPQPPRPKCVTRIIKGKPRTVCVPVVIPPKKKQVPTLRRPIRKAPLQHRRTPVVRRHTPPRSTTPEPKRSQGQTLRNDYYDKSCPQVEAIIRNKVTAWVKKDRSLAASLLRLHFHDCMATGCDASILLVDPVRRSTEMYSVFSKGLRGFEVVEDIKLALEKACPGVVSCADILTTIARDVTLDMHGPFWFVPFGRKDSLTSNIDDAVQVPHQESDANLLIKQFQAVGLTFNDLATLTGAHSVGKSHCFSFTAGGAAGANPHMNATYARALRAKCKPGPWEEVFNDDVTPYTLDLEFYKNLKMGNVLLKSDDSIYKDNSMTSSMVDAFLSQPGMWDAQFAVSMVKLGNVNVIAGPNQGEVRRVCSFRNRPAGHH